MRTAKLSSRPAGALITSPDRAFLFAHPAHLLALGFGAGLAPRAPGTFGTLLGFPLAWALGALPPALAWMGLAALSVGGIWICGRTGRALGVPDHGAIVWDEMVAFAMVLGVAPRSWPWLVAAFLLFRLFDIWKPFPIRQFDRTVKGGLGVMLDDLLAAGYAIAVLIATRAIWPDTF